MFETVVRVLLVNDNDDDDGDKDDLNFDLADDSRRGVTNRSGRQWAAESSNWRYAADGGASC